MCRRTSSSRALAVDVVVIGAGHAGLAMSHVLAGHGIDHVVIERGEVAQRWRTGHWDSLRLLTPNWMTRLPGFMYDGPDPDGYMRAAEVADFIEAYATRSAAPLRLQTTVTDVAADPGGAGYRVATDRGDWRCRAVVLANGAFDRPSLPRCAADVPSHVQQLTTATYRRPGDLAARGRVLVVGASASGLQLADEICRSGRDVTLAVGEHVRLPRRHRGRDIQWWMHAAGVLDQRIEDADDAERARRVPSPQLVGSAGHETLDLGALQQRGVEIVGRLAGIRDGRAMFSGGLRNVCALADLKMQRLLDTLDGWAQGRGDVEPPAARLAPTPVPAAPRLGLPLGAEVGSIVWATGAAPDYRWLRLPVFEPDGRLRHERGVVAPGIVALGLPFLRRRKSSFIHGAQDDACELGAGIVQHLRERKTRNTLALPR